MKPTSSSPTEAPIEQPAPLPRKPGADHSETASKPKKHDANFKQSNDLREDRGVRQLKSSPKNRT